MTTTLHPVNYSLEELAVIEKLSVRSQNTCHEASLDNLFKILLYYLKNGGFKSLQYCGVTTERELITLSQKYLNLTGFNEEILTALTADPLFDEFTRKCFKKIGISATLLLEFKEPFERKQMPFFNFLDVVLPYLLSEREYFIFTSNFGYTMGSKKKTLQSIGNIYDLTRERIRQISLRIPEKIKDALVELSDNSLFQNRYALHSVNTQKDFIEIDKDYVKEVNEAGGLNYTAKFYALVLSGLLSMQYFTFQSDDEVYATYFLISNKYKPLFDFGKFYDECISLSQTRRTTDEIFDNTDFLKQFQLNETELNDRVRQICKKICISEPGVHFDRNKIVFRRNTAVKISEHIISILEDAGKPLKLLEIYKELLSRTKRKISSPSSIRTSILVLDEVVAIGKTSTYALAKWSNVNSSTIKEIVRNYLDHQDEPKHINEITKYVNQYRRTNEKNIISNLKLDKNGIFVFFARGYVGLKYRHNKPKSVTPVEPTSRKKQGVVKKNDPNQLNLF